MKKNKLKKIRENMLLSKSELARKAGVSSLTIDRIEEKGLLRIGDCVYQNHLMQKKA
jgi:DNA-binding XRE family transcriptional regulator